MHKHVIAETKLKLIDIGEILQKSKSTVPDAIDIQLKKDMKSYQNLLKLKEYELEDDELMFKDGFRKTILGIIGK